MPKDLQKPTLEKIHAGHQGILRCRLRAKTSVWWPGISRDIEAVNSSCPTCSRENHPRKEPMIPTPLPDYPWQKIGTDLFHYKGNTYLVLIDYFSRYPEVHKLQSTTSYSIINAMKTVFARFGIPELLVSDNGPQYTSQEFNHFAKQYGFTQVTSSPYYPQGNGQAERTVQTVKRLLKENEDIHLALLNYRSTPFAWCGLSPAELLMGRRIRPALPTLTNNLIPGWEFLRDFQSKNKEFKERQRLNYNKHHGVRPLSPLPDSTHSSSSDKQATRSAPILCSGDTHWPNKEKQTTPQCSA